MEKKPRSKTYENSQKYCEIREALLNQLRANGCGGKHFTDLVDDYMGLWVSKCMLLEDVHNRGLYVRYNNGGGQSGTRKNDSVLDVLKVNAQMLKLLDTLGIKPDQSIGGGDEKL